MTKTAKAEGDEAGSAQATGAVNRTARAAGLMIVFVLLSRVLGVVRNIVIARIFGQNSDTDIYIRAFAVPDMLYLLLAGGALSTVFIPVFTEYLSQGREDEAWRTLGLVISLVAVVTGVLIVLAEIFAFPLARLVGLRFSADAVERMVPLTRILLPAQWFFFVGGLLMAALQARNRFLVPALGPIVYNAGIILGAVLFGRSFGVVSMTWGALAGAALGNFLLPLWEIRRSGARFALGWDRRHPGVVRFGQLLLPAMLGLGLSQLGFLITGFFLPEGGKLSALRNGYDLTQAPLGIFAQASAIVLFPTISSLAAQKAWPAFRHEVSQGIRRILFLTLPTSILMAVLAEPIIRLLYGGPRFGAEQIAEAALALRLYSLGTFAWSAQAVLGRGFFAMQDTKTPLAITKMMIVLFAVLCLGLFVVFDFAGLALAMSVMATVNAGLLLWRLHQSVGGLDVCGLAQSAGRIALASGLSGGVAFLLLRVLNGAWPPTKTAALLTLLIAGGSALAVYVGACHALRVDELRTVREMFRRRPS